MESCILHIVKIFPSVIFQRWSPRGRSWPRGHIFKFLALASKPQVLENCPGLGSRTALFFEWLKFCRSAEKCFFRRFFWSLTEKKFLRPIFLGKHLHLCPWSLALSITVLCLGLGFFCVLGLGLDPCVLDSTSVIFMLNIFPNVNSFQS